MTAIAERFFFFDASLHFALLFALHMMHLCCTAETPQTTQQGSRITHSLAIVQVDIRAGIGCGIELCRQHAVTSNSISYASLKQRSSASA